MKSSDYAFIANSWKRSLRAYSPELTTSAYYALANSVFDEVMSGFPKVYVACSPEDEDVILGWLCAEASPEALILWCAYTARPYRRENVGNRLLAEAMDELVDAGPETVYCPIGTRMDPWLKDRLGAGQMSWAKALHLRGRAA
jgi:hypothetical protein